VIVLAVIFVSILKSIPGGTDVTEWSNFFKNHLNGRWTGQ